MKRFDPFWRSLLAAVLTVLLSCMFLPAAAAASLEGLPGQEQWQPYLNAAPQDAQQFLEKPLQALRALLPQSPLRLLRQVLHRYADLLLFLLLLTVLSFLLGDTADSTLLELAAAGGCGTLVWNDLLVLAQTVCEQMNGWKNFLLGFLPIYSGVLAAGGEAHAGTAACGLLLDGLCVLAQSAALWVCPLLQSYLAVCMACCISPQKSLAEVCRATGTLLRKGLVWLGRAFALLLGLQRVVALQLDRTALHLGQLLTGSVPLIGQALSGAAETVLAGMQLLKSTLGIAALFLLGADFVPLYLELLLHLLLLSGCGLLCTLAGNHRCQTLFACLTEAVRCMAAVTALFFELALFGVVLLMAAGGG